MTELVAEERKFAERPINQIGRMRNDITWWSNFAALKTRCEVSMRMGGYGSIPKLPKRIGRAVQTLCPREG